MLGIGLECNTSPQDVRTGKTRSGKTRVRIRAEKENTRSAVRSSAAAGSPASGYRLPAIFTRILRFPTALSRGIVLPLIVRGRYASSHSDLTNTFATDTLCKCLTARLSSGNKLTFPAPSGMILNSYRIMLDDLYATAMLIPLLFSQILLLKLDHF